MCLAGCFRFRRNAIGHRFDFPFFVSLMMRTNKVIMKTVRSEWDSFNRIKDSTNPNKLSINPFDDNDDDCCWELQIERAIYSSVNWFICLSIGHRWHGHDSRSAPPHLHRHPRSVLYDTADLCWRSFGHLSMLSTLEQRWRFIWPLIRCLDRLLNVMRRFFRIFPWAIVVFNFLTYYIEKLDDGRLARGHIPYTPEAECSTVTMGAAERANGEKGFSDG